MPISLTCPNINTTSTGLYITLPGGAKVSAPFTGLNPRSISEEIQALMGQLNAALAPFEPIFSILDVVQVLFKTIKAVGTLNPIEIADAIPKLAEAVEGLLALFPPIGLIITVKDTVKAIAQFFISIAGEIRFQVARSAQIINAQQMADRTGYYKLLEAVACARGLQEAYILSLNNSFKPIATIIGIINTFLEIIGLGSVKIPLLGDFAADQLEDVLSYIDAISDFLKTLVKAIP